MGCGHAKVTENKTEDKDKKNNTVDKKKEDNQEKEKNLKKEEKNKDEHANSKKEISNTKEINKETKQETKQDKKDTKKDDDKEKEKHSSNNNDFDPNMKGKEEIHTNLINDEDDSIEDQKVENPIPLVVFGVFPPKVNKFEVLTEPLKEKGFYPISTSELLKSELDNLKDKKPSGNKSIKELIDNQENVPGEIVTKLILDFIEKKQNEDKVHKFFISGFPRCEDNSKTWKKLSQNKAKVIALIYLSYTRNEYHNELEEVSKLKQINFDNNQIDKMYNYFLSNTQKVFDDFGVKRLIKLSATLPDETIQSKVFKSGLFNKLDF